MGLALRQKAKRKLAHFREKWKNSFGRPRLFNSATPERLGAIYHEPSDMCLPDRIMLYALVRGIHPARVLEIGVRWGGGARIIAAALEDAGGVGKAVGIDPITNEFGCRPHDLFGRYQLVEGYSPDAIPKAVAALGGTIDLAIIDAMHTYDHVLADLRGVIPHLANGAHILLHDSFHVGIDGAASRVLEDHPQFVDCGFITRFPEISTDPVAYQGWRLLRAGTPASKDVMTQSFVNVGARVPALTPDLWNWDGYLQKIEQKKRMAQAVEDQTTRV